jgi:glucosamine-6-phosphate deaminase
VFNKPGSSLSSCTRVKSLVYKTILANACFFNNDTDSVPRIALIVGVKTIIEAREVVIIATRARKALTIQ